MYTLVHCATMRLMHRFFQASARTLLQDLSFTGIRKGTTRKSREVKARKNNRMQNTWSFYQLTQFITYKAARQGIRVEPVDAATEMPLNCEAFVPRR